MPRVKVHHNYNNAIKFVNNHSLVLARIEEEIQVTACYLSRESGKNLLAEMHLFSEIAEEVGMPRNYAKKMADELEKGRVKQSFQFYLIYLDAKDRYKKEIEQITNK